MVKPPIPSPSPLKTRVLSYDKDEVINTQFFETLFKNAKAEREYFYNIDGTKHKQ
jgi:23S rRNA G2069 N7-methylase RlmK/C1962 C5-methylase RlmI